MSRSVPNSEIFSFLSQRTEDSRTFTTAAISWREARTRRPARRRPRVWRRARWRGDPPHRGVGGQGSVDLSHDQSGDSLTSDLGEEADGGWACEDMSFYCDRCHKWVPSAQLRGEQPSYLKGDNFFKFICSDCSEDGKETFERMRLTWQQVVMLAMYNLSLEGTGRQGYFRWKEDICAFIGRHWNFLLGTRSL
ncbi:cysteine-rich protein 2-binding protein [Etheostoma spectabile]|uniref:cysteine-rich protein 2-binding protein n=1 Tax=Etheostoma spectabile TaxID=54343 RepID=UPI0013AF169C|nr:cysteine-rich protein 2-binding protein-like [Etheostoma spectabile]